MKSIYRLTSPQFTECAKESGICGLVFFSSRRRHTICLSDWSSDVCSSDLSGPLSKPTTSWNEAVSFGASATVNSARPAVSLFGEGVNWSTVRRMVRSSPRYRNVTRFKAGDRLQVLATSFPFETSDLVDIGEVRPDLERDCCVGELDSMVLNLDFLV